MNYSEVNKLIKIYVIALADSKGNFDWIYTHPKPFYYTRKEASYILTELCSQEPTITSKNSKILKLWKVTDE